MVNAYFPVRLLFHVPRYVIQLCVLVHGCSISGLQSTFLCRPSRCPCRRLGSGHQATPPSLHWPNAAGRCCRSDGLMHFKKSDYNVCDPMHSGRGISEAGIFHYLKKCVLVHSFVKSKDIVTSSLRNGENIKAFAPSRKKYNAME